MSADNIVMLGAGGHACVMLDALRAAGADVSGYIAPSEAGNRLEGVTWLGSDEAIADLPPGTVLVNGVGSAGDTGRRHRVHDAGIAAGFAFRTIVHPAALVAPSAILESGAQVLAGAIVGERARIGVDAIVNTGAIVDHDTVVGAHSHIATGAALAGDVIVGDDTHVGLGARIIEGVRVGSSCTMGAGAVVIADVPDRSLAVGVPAVSRPRRASDEDGV